MGSPKLLVSVLVSVAMLTGADDSAVAQWLPSKPVKIISPFSAGSPPDTFARLIAQQLSVRLGQGIVIENRPGAGSTIATKAGAAADPDGYTLLQANAALSYANVIYPNAGYDPVRSFVPIALLATWTHVLVGQSGLAASSLPELITTARANPGKINIGFPLGTPPQILSEMLKMESRADLNSVPYRQTPQLVADLLAGRVDLYFSAGEPIFSLIRQGKVKAFAFASVKRDPGFPSVPTMAEAGLPRLTFEQSDWTGFLAPAGTPPNVVATLNAAINNVLISAATQEGLAKIGWMTKISTPQEFAAFVLGDAEKWPPIVKSAGLRGE
jgi:tripartite-type tricarboxylate transporter receptor subunit TctC